MTGSTSLESARSLWRAAAAGTFLFAVVLAARLVARDVVITADEDNWMSRSGGFAFGLLNMQFGRTYQNGHPGVTTMWTAALTLGPRRMMEFSDRVSGQRFVARVPGFWEALVEARVGFAVVTAALVLAIAAIVHRLTNGLVAAVSAFLVGLEPFYLSISQLVHMDAILSGCMVASALAASGRLFGPCGRRWMAASGVLAGLALLSKVPALFLVGFVTLVGLAAWWSRSRTGTAVGAWRELILDLGTWGLATAVTGLLLWPAVWVLGPIEVAGRVAAFARETGGQPHEAGTFFWGSPRTDPGPLFYPVAAAFRLSPLTVLGVALLALNVRRVPAPWRPHLAALVFYAIGFVVMMTFGAKKLDRYVLPVFPALGVVAAAGLTLQVQRMVRGKRVVWVGAALVGLASLFPAFSAYPYFLSFYNPLLGGGAAAQRTVMVGNGEGLDVVAEWLNARPNAADQWVVAHSYDILQARLVGSGEPLRDRVPSNADYVVLYSFQTQIGHSPRVVNEWASQRTPDLVVTINGVEYARVYRGPHQPA
ncbi:MAG: glycosyltransferase family 39 protein [Chloroflexota bacterium]